MKKLCTILLFVIPFLSLNGIFAQSGTYPNSGLPLNPKSSPLFGKDIIINNQPFQNQENVCVCSAFNGWLFASYTYQTPQGPYESFLKSTDNGITWEEMLNGIIGLPSEKITKLDIIAQGGSLSDLKIFTAICNYDTNTMNGYVRVIRWFGDPFSLDQKKFQIGFTYDIAFASDEVFPASGANPYSIAILYSTYSSAMDSIIMVTSSNGGDSFTSHRIIQISTKRFAKVSLSYGYSPSKSAGRYFAAWEEKDNISSTVGHIYTAHSEPNFDSPFTTPICLDNLDPTATNMCRNPVIACQFDDTDNDSANFTSMILYEKFIPSENRYDISGFYNLQDASSGYYRPISVSSSTNNKLQPDLQYNPYENNFMMTYYDPDGQKLPFLTNDRNLALPDSWMVVSEGYNESSSLSDPKPQVKLNTTQLQGMNVWSKGIAGSNSVAMFDAPYSTYTSTPLEKDSKSALKVRVYPNPCTNYFYLEFAGEVPSTINVRIIDALGQVKMSLEKQNCGQGFRNLRIDLDDIPNGAYLVGLESNTTKYFTRLMVLR